MKQVKGKVKTGRTHLMDAMPIDFSQELSGWKAQLEANKKTIVQATNRMNELPQGGTAIGTSLAGIFEPKFALRLVVAVSIMGVALSTLAPAVPLWLAADLSWRISHMMLLVVVGLASFAIVLAALGFRLKEVKGPAVSS